MSDKINRPALWVPSLFLTDALPYITLTLLSFMIFKRLYLPHSFITSAVSCILIPWLFKPWILLSRRLQNRPKHWHLVAQALTGLCLLGIAWFLNTPWAVGATLLLFILISCCYTVQDGCSNHLYNQLSAISQMRYIRLRHTSYQVGCILVAGVLIMLAGGFETQSGHIQSSWSTVFALLAGLFFLTLIFHEFVLPDPRQHLQRRAHKWKSFKRLASRPGASAMMAYALLYRLPQALLIPVVPLFLLDPPSRNGAGLSTQELGLCLGTAGLIALAVGSYVGHEEIRKKGVEACRLKMRLCMNLPVALLLLISSVGIRHFLVVTLIIFLTNFCYSYGFSACLSSLKAFSRKDAEIYAWGSVFLSLGLILPGFAAGFLQEQLDYTPYFILVILSGFIPLKKFIVYK